MSGAFEVAGVGLSAQQKALDVIANNIANINTRGFKRSEVRFSEMVSQTDPSAAVSARLDVSGQIAGVSAGTAFLLDQQGVLEPTENKMDFAIDGAGFVELMASSGQTYLWRGGSLQVDENGLLSADNGLPLSAAITVPLESAGLRIEANGDVYSESADEGAAELIGRISIVRPDGLDALERLDGGLYQVQEGGRILSAVAGEDGAGRIVQGSVERSNVDLNAEMVKLMIVQRAYSANAQLVQAADEIIGIANSLKR